MGSETRKCSNASPPAEDEGPDAKHGQHETEAQEEVGEIVHARWGYSEPSMFMTFDSSKKIGWICMMINAPSARMEHGSAE